MSSYSDDGGGKKPLSWWRKQSRNLFFFSSVILAADQTEKFQDLGLLHEYLCNFLDETKRPSKRKQVVVFRGSFKTTILMAYCVWRFCWAIEDEQTLPIVYNTATRENAEAFMEDFREILRETKALKWIFKKLPLMEDQYRRFTLRKVEYKGVKFHAASLETRQVSRHYKIIINDDLVNDKNMLSEDLREKVISQWKLQKSILTRYTKTGVGTEIDVGTPYHSRDLVNHIRKIKSYDAFIVPYAFEDGRGKVDPMKQNGLLSFPEMFEWEDFRMKREEQGASIFANQYSLETLEETDVLCKPEWIRRWSTLPETYKRVMVVDPAGMADKSSSASGITICDIDPLGFLYIIFADRFWVTPGQLVTTMNSLREQFRPDEIYVEKEKYSTTIADTMQHLAPKLQFGFVEHEGMQKEARIMRMKQHFELGKILIGKNMEALEDMILSYQGQKENVDLLDSLAYQIKILDPPRAGRRRSEEGRTQDDFSSDLERIKASLNPRGANYHDSIY